MGASNAKGTTSPQLVINLFGRFEVFCERKLITEEAWGRRKNKLLLKVLLTDPGRTFSQDELVETLFEGKNPEKAIKNLQGRVSQLRRVLESGLRSGRESAFILRREGGYCFAQTNCVKLDTVLFERFLEKGQSLQEQEQWASAAQVYQEAIRLYRGEFLQEDRYAEWAMATRERYASQHLDGLMQLAECWARLEAFRKAIESCERALEIQPHCEPVYRQAMRYHCLAGEYSQALNDYARCVQVLKEYLGVAPDPQTQELYHRIKDRDPEVFARPVRGNRLAVIPFHCLESDPQIEAVARGICINLITRLSMLESVWVASWMDVKAYASSASSSRQIADDLRVRYVLEGSIESTETRLRVSSRLIDALERKHIWAGHFDQELSSSESLQDWIAAAILQDLPRETKMFAELRDADRLESQADVESLILAGRGYLAKRSEKSLARAVESFQEALKRTPDAAGVWADLATAYAYQVMSGFQSVDDLAHRSRIAIQHAAESGSSSPRTHLASALVKWTIEHNLEGAEEEFREALHSNPGLGAPGHWYATFLMRTGRMKEGLTLARKAQALDQSLLTPNDNEVHARPWTRPTSMLGESGLPLPPSEVAKLRQFMPVHAIAKMFSARDRSQELKWLTFLFAETVLLDGEEAMGDPEALKLVTREALQRMVRSVVQYGGAIAQIRVNGILALFGLPVAHEDDVERAVRAALRIRERLHEGTPASLADVTTCCFDVRSGIDVGLVLVDEEGTDSSAPSLPVGSAIQTAAFLESVAAPGEILISDRVRQITEPLFHFSSVTAKRGVWKAHTTQAFEVDAAHTVQGKARGIGGMIAPMVGRDGELRTLTECLEQLIDGRGRIVSVVGEAGIGKTRLVSELLTAVSSDEIQIARLRCVSYQQEQPYCVCRDLVSQFLGLICPDEPNAITQLQLASTQLFPKEEDRSEVVPFLAVLLGIEDASDRITEALDPALVHQQLASSAVRLVEQSANRMPLVLLLDDAHWMDHESALVLEKLFEVVDRAPVLLLLVHREEYGDELRRLSDEAAFEYRHRHVQLRVGALGEDDERSMIDHLLSHSALPEGIYALVMRKSEGNPLFAEEIIRLLVDKEVIRLDESNQWLATRIIRDVEIPPRLMGLLAARIAHLNPATREALQLASTLGRAFEKDLLQACLSEHVPLDTCLLELQRAGLIHEIRGAPQQQFAFRHELMKEAAYETLPGTSRVQLHSRVASAIETLRGGSPGEDAILGDHLYKAHEWDRAVEYLLPAADQTWALYKSIETATLLARALQAAEKGEKTTPEVLYSIRRRRSEVFALLGQVDEERDELEALQQIGERLKTKKASAEISLRWSDFRCRRGDYREAREEASVAVEQMRGADDQLGEARALLACGEAALGLSDFDGAREDLETSLRILHRIGEPTVEAAVQKFLGTVAVRLGDFDLAMSCLKSSLSLYKELGDRKGEASISGNLGSLSIYLEKFEDAIQYTQDAQRVFRVIGDKRGQAKCLANLGVLHSALGNPELATTFQEEALSIYKEIHDSSGEAESLGNLAVAYESIGAGGYPELATEILGPHPEFEEAHRLNMECLTKCQNTGNRQGEAITYFNLGSTSLCGGNLDDAARFLQEALRVAREIGIARIAARTLSAMARLELHSGNPPKAVELSNEAVQLVAEQRIPIVEEIHFTHSMVLRAMGQADRAAASLQLAAEAVLAKANAIQADDTRARFLTSCKPIMDAWRKLEAA